MGCNIPISKICFTRVESMYKAIYRSYREPGTTPLTTGRRPFCGVLGCVFWGADFMKFDEGVFCKRERESEIDFAHNNLGCGPHD